MEFRSLAREKSRDARQKKGGAGKICHGKNGKTSPAAVGIRAATAGLAARHLGNPDPTAKRQAFKNHLGATLINRLSLLSRADSVS
jgi:hypothetical protein